VRAQALFAESEEEAKEVADKLIGGGDFGPLANKYSRETLTQSSNGNLDWLPKGFADMLLPGDLAGSLLKDIPFNLEPGMLSEPTYDASVTKNIGYWIVEVTEKDENQGSHARGILLGSRNEAAEIRARIAAGDDFGALAKLNSQDLWSREQGGDLGWIKPGGDVGNSVVTGLALRLQPGVLSEPAADSSVQTKGGYWLVKVVDRDDSRAFDKEIREDIILKLFDDWVSEHRQEGAVETYLTEKQKAWAVNRVLKDRGL
jgi:parvulin-like peptidyl-prolyl isomerase